MIPCILLILAACDHDEPAPPSEEQSAQLNEAEEMLNEMGGTEKGPEASASGPSNSAD